MQLKVGEFQGHRANQAYHKSGVMPQITIAFYCCRIWGLVTRQLVGMVTISGHILALFYGKIR